MINDAVESRFLYYCRAVPRQ